MSGRYMLTEIETINGDDFSSNAIYFGQSIATAKYLNTYYLAVGGHYPDGSSSSPLTGEVYVLSSNWPDQTDSYSVVGSGSVITADTFDSTQSGEEFGYSIDLSAHEGNLYLVVGARRYYIDFPGNENGRFFVFKYNGSSWSLRGNIIQSPLGQSNDEHFGSSVSINKNGTIVTIGAPKTTIGGRTEVGAAYVYFLKESTSTWVLDSDSTITLNSDSTTFPINSDISILGTGSVFGTSVATNDDGDIFAIGAPMTGTTFKTGEIFSISLSSVPEWVACFNGDAMVLTDQGKIMIKDINKDIHTIKKRKILGLVQCHFDNKGGFLIPKDGIEKNVPDRDTKIGWWHRIWYKGKLRLISRLYNKGKLPKLIPIDGNGETFYTIYLEVYGKMKINNILAETLNTDSHVCHYYNKFGLTEMSHQEQLKFFRKKNFKKLLKKIQK